MHRIPWYCIFLSLIHLGNEKASKLSANRYFLGNSLNSSPIKVVNFYFSSSNYPNVDVLSLLNNSYAS
jgi:hypothetical protein